MDLSAAARAVCRPLHPISGVRFTELCFRQGRHCRISWLRHNLQLLVLPCRLPVFLFNGTVSRYLHSWTGVDLFPYSADPSRDIARMPVCIIQTRMLVKIRERLADTCGPIPELRVKMVVCETLEMLAGRVLCAGMK